MKYRRATAEGASFFFTVNLADRGADTLVQHVDELREVTQQVKQAHPFVIIAMVVLPEHLHAVHEQLGSDSIYSHLFLIHASDYATLIGPTRAFLEDSQDQAASRCRYSF